MNIESTSNTVESRKTETAKSSSSSALINESSGSFKKELEAVKTQENTEDSQKTEQIQQAEAQKNEATEEKSEKELAETQKAKNEQTQNNQKVKENVLVNKSSKDEEESDTIQKSKELLNELKSHIVNINNLKNSSNQTNTIEKKNLNKSDFCQTMQMNNSDIKFFVNLVENQQMTVQTGQANNVAIEVVNKTFTEVKSEAVQQTVQVSQVLMDALNKSIQTNKPFRIDFDNDIAVIMKVDKNGTLSANFIPGSAAVENYLRNNIAGLRQNFDNQNLPYNELTYSNREKQEQQKERNEQKENK